MLFSVRVGTAQAQPLLGPLESALVLDALQGLRRKRQLLLHAFAIVPVQVALLLGVPDADELAPAMGAWQGFAARQINQLHGARAALWNEGFEVTTLQGSEAIARAHAELLALPVNLGLARSPQSYLLCSAHPERARLVDPLP